MAPQLSPAWTVYSTGGSGVRVGVSVGISVSVGVKVRVAVMVGLGMGVGAWIWCVPCRVKYNAPAPITRKPASTANATGRLSVTSGIRAPCTDLSDFAFGLGVALNSLPQTTQRVAFSVRRVPHVGHSLVEVVSGLIISALYHGASGRGVKRPIDIAHNQYNNHETCLILAL